MDDLAQARIETELAPAANDAVRALIGELNAALSALYLPEQRHGLDMEALFQSHIRFFIARRDGEIAGCGGVALFADFAELKRLYVRPQLRGGGVADAIMDRLLREAAGAGLKRVRLETGASSAAAIRFYRRRGFAPCEAFAPYSSMPAEAIVTSVFMERLI